MKIRMAVAHYERTSHGQDLFAVTYSLREAEDIGDRQVASVWVGARYRYVAGGSLAEAHPIVVTLVGSSAHWVVDEAAIYDQGYLVDTAPRYVTPTGDGLRFILANAGIYRHDGQLRAEVMAAKLGVPMKGVLQ